MTISRISELIKNKSNRDQEWLEQRRAERETLSEMRDAALEEITTNPERYQQYLTLQGDNIGCSAGNVVLTMFQLHGATKIGTTDYWHEQGRYVRESAMGASAKVFVPPRNGQRRGYLLGDYYDVEQTTGKPLKEQIRLTDDSPKMDNALAALMNFSPVPISERQDVDLPAYYDDVQMNLYINPNYSETEIFSALAVEVTYARIHDKGRNGDFDREVYHLDAESVGYMLCRRFGVECPVPRAGEVGCLYDGYEPATRSDILEQLRKTARNIGDGIDRAIQPRQQERGRKRYVAR